MNRIRYITDWSILIIDSNLNVKFIEPFQPKMCKIQFQDESDTESDTEEFADIVPESSCSRSVPMMSSVQAAAQGKSV